MVFQFLCSVVRTFVVRRYVRVLFYFRSDISYRLSSAVTFRYGNIRHLLFLPFFLPFRLFFLLSGVSLSSSSYLNPHLWPSLIDFLHLKGLSVKSCKTDSSFLNSYNCFLHCVFRLVFYWNYHILSKDWPYFISDYDGGNATPRKRIIN